MLKSQQDGAAKVPQDEQSLASLLRFLIQIVMKQGEGPQESEAKKEATRQNLKELLTMQTGGNDPLHSWRMSVFGS